MLAFPKPPKGGARKERVRKRKAEKRDKAYLAFMAQFPCVVGRECEGPLAIHHEPPRSHIGWHDRKTLRLCRRHHAREVPGSRHALGYPGFCARWGVDLHEMVAHFNRLYEGTDATSLVAPTARF